MDATELRNCGLLWGTLMEEEFLAQVAATELWGHTAKGGLEPVLV